MRRLAPVSLLLLLAGCQGNASRDAASAALDVPPRVRAEVPADVLAVLEQPDRLELLSLHPSPRAIDEKRWTERGYDALERVDDYAVLGGTTLDEAGRAMVLRAVYEGIQASDGRVAACFNPRHALRARRGTTVVEAVICYECLSMTFRKDGAHAGSATTTGKPAAKLTAVLREAGVPLPDA